MTTGENKYAQKHSDVTAAAARSVQVAESLIMRHRTTNEIDGNQQHGSWMGGM